MISVGNVILGALDAAQTAVLGPSGSSASPGTGAGMDGPIGAVHAIGPSTIAGCGDAPMPIGAGPVALVGAPDGPMHGAVSGRVSPSTGYSGREPTQDRDKRSDQNKRPSDRIDAEIRRAEDAASSQIRRDQGGGQGSGGTSRSCAPSGSSGAPSSSAGGWWPWSK